MRLSLLPLSLLVLTLSACNAHSTRPSEEPRRPVVGGFGSCSVGDEQVVLAAEYAVKELQASDPSVELVQIRSAQTQVVAGMNYKLDLDLRSAEGEKATRVVVYRDLDGQYSLTSSEPIK